MDPWMELVSNGRIAAYVTEPWGPDVRPLPQDVPCDDHLVIACRQLGLHVYPVFERDLRGAE